MYEYMCEKWVHFMNYSVIFDGRLNKKLKTGVIISSGSGLNNSGNGQSKQSKKSKNKKQQQPQHCWCCRADQTYTLEKGIMLNKNMILFQLQVMVKRIGKLLRKQILLKLCPGMNRVKLLASSLMSII